MPISSRNSRRRQSSKVSSGCRLPPGNSHNPPRCASNGRCVINNLPSRKTKPAATSIEGRTGGNEGRLTDLRGDEPFLILRPSDFSVLASSADALVNESELFHFPRIEQVSAIEHNRM